MTVTEMKSRLRLTNDALNGEIAAKMTMAEAELARVGVQLEQTEEHGTALIDYAVELFVKGEFNFDGRGERYAAQFESVRNALKLTGAMTKPPEPEPNAQTPGVS